MIHDYSTGEMPKEQEPRYNTEELSQEFEVLSFCAPYIVVRRKSDGKKGTMQFNHSPRVYWGFKPDA